MINYDLHIHTDYCGHAPGMTIRAIIARAESLELETIGLTIHIFGPGDLGLLEPIKTEVGKIKTDCRVIVGAEIDVDGYRSNGTLVTGDLETIDYVVASIHYVPTVGNYPFTPEDCTLKPAELLGGWRTTLLGVVSNSQVDTLAHPGRMIATAIDLDVHFDDVLAVFGEAAKLSADNNIAWELNELTGYRLDYYYQQQWYRLYEIALEYGVKLIYGSDAHDLDSVGRSAFTNSILKNLPPNSLATPRSFNFY